MWIYFLRRQHKTCLAFEVFGGCWAQHGIQECRTRWEHLWGTDISCSWAYYQGAWLEHKTSHVNTDFCSGKYSNWAVSTYFNSASPILSSLTAEWGGWPLADEHITLGITDERRNDWTVMCSSTAILAASGWVSSGFWQSFVWWQTC